MKPKIIKDLGYIYLNSSSKQKRRALVVECPICEKHSRVGHYDYHKGKVNNCKSCSQRIASTVHGLTKHRIFKVHSGMRQRCYNKNNNHFNSYGGRGIVICKDWQRPKAFYDWAINNGYSDELTIDRIDNDGNYEPSNCRWTTKEVQSRNTRLYNTNTSGYRGVAYRKDSETYRAYITVSYKRINLGNNKSAKIAGLIYNSFVIKNNLEHNANDYTEKEISELRAEGYEIEGRVADKDSGALEYFMPEHMEKTNAN